MSNARGSGSGSGTTTTVQDGSDQPGSTAEPLDGSGSGSGSGPSSGSTNTTVQFGESLPIHVLEEAFPCGPISVSIPVEVGNPNPYSGVSVNYATQNGSALAGADYTAQSGTLGFAPDSSGPDYINVPILDDGDDESVGNEYFTVSLSNPQGATLGAPSTFTVYIEEGPQQAATDTLRWNPCDGNNASTVTNWYDVTQRFQLQKGALGPNPSSPIQFDANSNDTPNSNAPITWDQSSTVASISLSEYTGNQTIKPGVAVESNGTGGTSLSMDGSSNLNVSFGDSNSKLQLDNNSTITNMQLIAFTDGQGLFRIKGGTTTIQQSPGYIESDEGVPIDVAQGATLNDQSYSWLTLSASNTIISVEGTMKLFYGPGNGQDLISVGNTDTNCYINVNGGFLGYYGRQNVVDTCTVPVVVQNGGTFRVTVNSLEKPIQGWLIVQDGPTGDDYIAPNGAAESVYMTGDSSSVQLANYDVLECDNGYYQASGTLETTDATTCTLQVGAQKKGTADIQGGTVWIDTLTNSYGTLNVSGNMNIYGGTLWVSIQGYPPTGTPGTSDKLSVNGTLFLDNDFSLLYVTDYGTLQKTVDNTDFWSVIGSTAAIGGNFSSESSDPPANLSYGLSDSQLAYDVTFNG